MSFTIHHGDCLEVLRDMAPASAHCCVTSPPYFGLRDYGHEGQIGLEPSPEAYVEKLVAVFREVRRVLRDDGTLWLNLGDSYSNLGGPGWQGKNGDRADRRFTGTRDTDAMKSQARVAYTGYKSKDLLGVPWMVAFALRADGWFLRQDIIWAKPNPMPESVRDRCTKAHEYLFLLSKSERYHFDAEAISEESVFGAPNSPSSIKSPYGQGFTRRGRAAGADRGTGEKVYERRNKRSVWTVSTKPFQDAHFATFPPDLIEPCIAAGCPVNGTVLDPFGGAGTTGLVAERMGRNSVMVELNRDYVEMATLRIVGDAPLFTEGAS